MSKSQSAFVAGVVAASLGAYLFLHAAPIQPTTAAPVTLASESTRIAVLDVLAVSEKLFLSTRYSPARESRIKVKQDEISAMESSIQDLIGKIQAAGQNSPEGAAMITSYQSKMTEFNNAKQKATDELGTFSTEQFAECYKLAVETANALAKKSGYTHVLATRVGPFEFRSKELPAALQEVLARPVLMGIDSDDLTPAVLKELKLDAAPEKKDEPKKDEPKHEEPKPADKK